MRHVKRFVPFRDDGSQREWLLASPLVATLDATEYVLTLTSQEPTWIDVSRCVLQAMPTGAPLGIDQGWDLTRFTRATEILYKNRSFFLRNEGNDPSGPAGLFSAFRDPRSRETAIGPLFLDTRETLTFRFIYDLEDSAAAGVAGFATLAVPAVPESNIGQPVLQKPVGGQTWDESWGAQYLVSDDTALPAAGAVEIETAYPDTGLVDIGSMQISATTDGSLTVPMTDLIYGCSMQSIKIPGGKEELILNGDVPASMFANMGRNQRWVELGYWGGGRTQNVTVEITNHITAGRVSLGYSYLGYGDVHPASEACR